MVLQVTPLFSTALPDISIVSRLGAVSTQSLTTYTTTNLPALTTSDLLVVASHYERDNGGIAVNAFTFDGIAGTIIGTAFQNQTFTAFTTMAYWNLSAAANRTLSITFSLAPARHVFRSWVLRGWKNPAPVQVKTAAGASSPLSVSFDAQPPKGSAVLGAYTHGDIYSLSFAELDTDAAGRLTNQTADTGYLSGSRISEANQPNTVTTQHTNGSQGNALVAAYWR
jgi:hypothetical protein